MATPPKPVGPDFCLVQLTAAGCALAGNHSLRYSNGATVYVFQPNEPIKVAKYEWQLALQPHTTADGKALFEIYTGPTQNDAVPAAIPLAHAPATVEVAPEPAAAPVVEAAHTAPVVPPAASPAHAEAPAPSEPNSTQAQTTAKETK